jgi:predicted Holliday junction resolvase-like endonuclease
VKAALIYISLGLTVIIKLLAILIMIRVVSLLKRVRSVANQILANDMAMKQSLPRIIAKSIVRTVAIMNSKDDDAKAKLREMISEE